MAGVLFVAGLLIGVPAGALWVGRVERWRTTGLTCGNTRRERSRYVGSAEVVRQEPGPGYVAPCMALDCYAPEPCRHQAPGRG